MYLFGKFCRICVKKPKNLYDLAARNEADINLNYFGMLESVYPDLINLDENLPELICEQCRNHLDAAYSFKIKCFKSFVTLKNYTNALKLQQDCLPEDLNLPANKNKRKRDKLYGYYEETSRKIFFDIKRLKLNVNQSITTSNSNSFSSIHLIEDLEHCRSTILDVDSNDSTVLLQSNQLVQNDESVELNVLDANTLDNKDRTLKLDQNMLDDKIIDELVEFFEPKPTNSNMNSSNNFLFDDISSKIDSSNVTTSKNDSNNIICDNSSNFASSTDEDSSSNNNNILEILNLSTEQQIQNFIESNSYKMSLNEDKIKLQSSSNTTNILQSSEETFQKYIQLNSYEISLENIEKTAGNTKEASLTKSSKIIEEKNLPNILESSEEFLQKYIEENSYEIMLNETTDVPSSKETVSSNEEIVSNIYSKSPQHNEVLKDNFNCEEVKKGSIKSTTNISVASEDNQTKSQNNSKYISDDIEIIYSNIQPKVEILDNLEDIEAQINPEARKIKLELEIIEPPTLVYSDIDLVTIKQEKYIDPYLQNTEYDLKKLNQKRKSTESISLEPNKLDCGAVKQNTSLLNVATSKNNDLDPEVAVKNVSNASNIIESKSDQSLSSPILFNLDPNILEPIPNIQKISTIVTSPSGSKKTENNFLQTAFVNNIVINPTYNCSASKTVQEQESNATSSPKNVKSSKNIVTNKSSLVNGSKTDYMQNIVQNDLDSGSKTVQDQKNTNNFNNSPNTNLNLTETTENSNLKNTKQLENSTTNTNVSQNVAKPNSSSFFNDKTTSDPQTVSTKQNVLNLNISTNQYQKSIFNNNVSNEKVLESSVNNKTDEVLNGWARLVRKMLTITDLPNVIEACNECGYPSGPKTTNKIVNKSEDTNLSQNSVKDTPEVLNKSFCKCISPQTIDIINLTSSPERPNNNVNLIDLTDDSEPQPSSTKKATNQNNSASTSTNNHKHSSKKKTQRRLCYFKHFDMPWSNRDSLRTPGHSRYPNYYMLRANEMEQYSNNSDCFESGEFGPRSPDMFREPGARSRTAGLPPRCRNCWQMFPNYPDFKFHINLCNKKRHYL